MRRHAKAASAGSTSVTEAGKHFAGADKVASPHRNRHPGAPAAVSRGVVRIVLLTALASIATSILFLGGSVAAAAVPSQVFTGYVAPRTDTTARLNGYINPQGSEAAYHFEYSADGASWTVLSGHTIAAGVSRQIVVGEDITGLQPNTTYHYRLFAENSEGPASPQGQEKTFTTRTTAEMQLPTRGIELVNQPDKGNQNVSNEGIQRGQHIITEDGNKAFWTVVGGAPGANSGAFATFLSTRTAEGWKSRSVIPAPEDQLGGGDLTYKLNEANGSLTRFLFRALIPGAFGDGPPTFVRVDDLGHQDVLQTFNVETPNSLVYRKSEMTEDGSDVLFVNPGTRQLEDSTTTPPEVVSLMPDGTPNACGLDKEEGNSFTGEGGSGAEAATAQWRFGYRRMARTDGRRVYFQAVPNGSPCNSKLAIYYRDRNTEQTIEIDTGGASSQSSLIRTTPDGRSVYFVSDVAHVPGDTNTTRDVYRWNSDTEDYTCLTCVVAEAAVQGMVMVSDDFSHVYFTSKKQLMPGYGAAGDGNVYVVRNGELGFVADGLAVNAILGFESALSPDGNALVFPVSNAQSLKLTADQFPESCQGGEGGRCKELLRYEDSTESLECVSCRVDGPTQYAFGAPYTFSQFAFQISSDGSTVAFITRERLLKQDINDSYDVYEWRNGKVGLVTDGETLYPVSLGGTSPQVRGIDRTGDNIFFSVVDPGLTGYEQDELANLYDARVGGGFPRPQEAVHCSEESCQGPLQAAPSQPAAGSNGLEGAGNARSNARGRCVGKRGKARHRCLHTHKDRHKRHRRNAHHRKGGGTR